MFPTIPPYMVAASLDYRIAQVQRTEVDPISRTKFGGKRRSTRGPDEEDRQCSGY
jgi:hypothetical protein